MQQTLDFGRRLFCDAAAATAARHEPVMSDAERSLNDTSALTPTPLRVAV